MGMKKQLIRLGNSNPSLQKHIKPILNSITASSHPEFFFTITEPSNDPGIYISICARMSIEGTQKDNLAGNLQKACDQVEQILAQVFKEISVEFPDAWWVNLGNVSVKYTREGDHLISANVMSKDIWGKEEEALVGKIVQRVSGLRQQAPVLTLR